jgi:hypothetical protein
MAKINKPTRKGTPPSIEDTKSNLDKSSNSKKVQLKFSVDESFKKEFQIYAIENGMNMSELLKVCFEEFKK